MIERYTRPEMGAVWSERRKFDTWLQVELAVVDVLAADFPQARLAVPYEQLRRVDRGVQGSRLVELPVLLRG